jgi:hypothetical protein
MGRGEDWLAAGAVMGRPIKYEMSLEAIAESEGTTVGAINVCLGRALKKLRKRGLQVITCRELMLELESHRNTDYSVYRRNARKGGME